MLKKGSGEKTLTTVIYEIQELQSQGKPETSLADTGEAVAQYFLPKEGFFPSQTYYIWKTRNE